MISNKDQFLNIFKCSSFHVEMLESSKLLNYDGYMVYYDSANTEKINLKIKAMKDASLKIAAMFNKPIRPLKKSPIYLQFEMFK